MATSGSRREAILEAMIRVAGGNGYAATSVADVIAEAGASRATFYKHFEDKHECFLIAFEVAAERIHAAAVAACNEKGDWRERARSSLAAVARLLAADPALARIAIVEAATAGAEARRRHWEALGRLARLLDEESPALGRAELPASVGVMAVAGVAGLIFDELQEGRAAELPRLLPELEFALFVPYFGPRGAAEAREASAASPASL